MTPYDDWRDSWPRSRDGQGQERLQRRVADERIAEQTAQALRTDAQIYGRYLEILVQNRVVILRGEVASDDAKAAAGRRAWTVAEVFDVCNRLTVTEPGRWYTG